MAVQMARSYPAGLTGAAFSRFFRRHVGTTFESYVDKLRIDRACRTLAVDDGPITAVAFGSGFGSVAHFNRRFLARTGISPTEYRRLAGHQR